VLRLPRRTHRWCLVCSLSTPSPHQSYLILELLILSYLLNLWLNIVYPPRPSAVRRRAPLPPPRSPPVEFACACSSFRCFSRGVWSTPTPYPPCAAARRRAPPPTRHLGRRILIRRIRSIRPGQTRHRRVKPTLTLVVLQGKPRISLDLQAGPPTV
jgi:hypothetical protein